MSVPVSDSRKCISVVVPVFNAAENLPELVKRLESVLVENCDGFELILVNDGSKDSSWACIQELAIDRKWLKGIDLTRNYGQHNALLVGIRAASQEFILTIDDDLQHPPEEIPKLLAALNDDLDVVYGTPEKLPHSVGRNLASLITKVILQKAMGADTARRIDAFRVFRTVMREGFAKFSGPFVSIDVLLTWSTSRFGWIHVNHEPRKRGESNYTFYRLVTHALNMLTGFSTLPLQIASWTGFATLIFGFLAMSYALIRNFIEGAAPAGFPFLVSLITIFSGAQLMALGIIGEYLARAHFRIMDRPAFVVRRETE